MYGFGKIGISVDISRVEVSGCGCYERSFAQDVCKTKLTEIRLIILYNINKLE